MRGRRAGRAAPPTRNAGAGGGGVGGGPPNRPAGGVEGVFVGGRPAVQRLVSWCYSGPTHAAVEKVEVSWEEPTGKEGGFAIVW